MQPFAAHLFRRLHHVHRVVGDALKVPDDVQQFGHLPVVSFTEVFPAQFDQIGAQHVLILVGFLLRLPHCLGLLGIVVLDQAAAGPQGIHRDPGHGFRHFLAAANGHGRGAQQTLVQDLDLLGNLVVPHQAAGQFLQQAGEGEKQRRTQHVKGGMHYRNPQLVDGVADKVEVHHCVDEVENRQPHAGTNDVEQQVHHSSPLGVLVGPYRGKIFKHQKKS